MPPIPPPIDERGPTPAEVQRATEILAAHKKRTVKPGGGLFKLMAGKHAVGSGATRRIYVKGDTIQSDVDLTKFDPNKFRALKRVTVPTPADQLPQSLTPQEGQEDDDGLDTDLPSGTEEDTSSDPAVDETLDAMTVHELQQLAQEEEIDLTGATRKADIIARIKGQRSVG